MAKKELESISTHYELPSELDGFKEYFGKKVISNSGEALGTIIDVLYEDDTMVGVKVRNGFSQVFIDKEYFAGMSEKNLMLSIDSVLRIKGKLVLDADGRKLGRVISVNRPDKSNNFDSISVKKGIFSKPIDIPAEDIAVCKKNIILNKVY